MSEPTTELPYRSPTALDLPSDEPRKGSLLVIFLTVFIDLLGFGIVLPLLPVYAKHLNVDPHGVEIGLLMASFSAMQFLGAPVWGRISDRVGRRPVLLVGLAGSVVFYALFGFATVSRSLTWLFISRIGAGLAGATISTTAAYIADVTPLEKRAKGMALIGAAFGLGFTFGPLLAAAALVSAGDNEPSAAPGFVAAGLSAVAFALALFMLPESLRPGAPAARRKLIDIAALRAALETPSIALFLLTSFISVLSFASFETTLALLLSNPQGLDLKLHQVSMYFAYIGIVLSLAQGVLVRRLADRVREEIMATAGAVVSILGFAALAITSSQSGIGWLMVATAVEVTGFALMTPSLNSLISRRSDPAKQGGVMGVNQSVSALARITGPAAIPLFYIQPTLPYWAAAGLMVAALFLVHIASRRGGDFVAVAVE